MSGNEADVDGSGGEFFELSDEERAELEEEFGCSFEVSEHEW